MLKYLSYLYPITRKIKSDYSDTLEITWYNGKKHLNTKNANYSYGSLQAILKFGLEQMDLKKVQSVLLLGLGGGSVIETLRTNFNYKNKITAVDIDPVVIDIAKTEYQLDEDAEMSIICQDALAFVKEETSTYDLIIVDLFIDTNVPKTFMGIPFWEELLKLRTTQGCFLFNASLEEEKSDALITLINYLKTKIYKVDVYDKVNETNTLIIAYALN